MKSNWIDILSIVAPNISNTIQLNADKNNVEIVLRHISTALLEHDNATEREIERVMLNMSLNKLQKKLYMIDQSFNTKQDLHDIKQDTLQELSLRTGEQESTTTHRSNHIANFVAYISPFLSMHGLRLIFAIEILTVLGTITLVFYITIQHILCARHDILQWAINENATEMIMHMISSQDNIIFLALGGATGVVGPSAVKLFKRKF